MTVQQKCSNQRERLSHLRDAIRAALAASVGQGKPVADARALGALCSRSEETGQRYLRGDTIPDLAAGLLLMDRLGPDFAAPLLLQAGLAGVFRVDGTCPAGDTLREVVEGAATLAAAWADLRIDHTEWPAVQRELHQAMVCIAQFLASGGAR